LDSLSIGCWNKAVEELAAKINESFGAKEDKIPEVAVDRGPTNVIGAVEINCEGFVNMDDREETATRDCSWRLQYLLY
jgi:hypothetical protein